MSIKNKLLQSLIALDAQYFKTTNQLILGGGSSNSGFKTTVNSIAPAANRLLTIPALSADDSVALLAQPQALANKTYNGLTVTTTTGTLSITNSKTLTVSNTLTFTGTDLSSVAFGAGGTVLYSDGVLISTSPIAGIGYGVGAGGTVTQTTSKATDVTLDRVSGKITMNNAELPAANTVTFILTNSTIAATDTVSISIVSGEATDASYQILTPKVAAGSCKITIWNITSTPLSEALVLQFNVHRGAIS